MDTKRKEVLKDIYYGWILDTICQWEDEHGAWDHILGVDLDEEEWRWITANLNYEVKVFDMNKEGDTQ